MSLDCFPAVFDQFSEKQSSWFLFLRLSILKWAVLKGYVRGSVQSTFVRIFELLFYTSSALLMGTLLFQVLSWCVRGLPCAEWQAPQRTVPAKPSLPATPVDVWMKPYWTPQTSTSICCLRTPLPCGTEASHQQLLFQIPGTQNVRHYQSCLNDP